MLPGTRWNRSQAKSRLPRRAACLAVLVALLGTGAAADPTRPYKVTEEREPCRDFDPQRRPFFGDTHVHTAFSFDASTQDTRNTPRDAYRFARGEPLGI